jgi:hypothetical protein
MKKQQLNQQQLAEKLKLEEFRYWDGFRNKIAGQDLEEIKMNIVLLQNALCSGLLS